MNGFMTEFFYMSLTASYLVIIILLLRLFLDKAPKWIRVILWGMVGIRLLLPIRLESAFSLIPRVMTPRTADIAGGSADTMNQVAQVQAPVLPNLDAGAGVVTSGPEAMVQQTPEISWMTILFIVWAAGVTLMLVYCIVSYVRLTLRMREAVKYAGNGSLIYQSERVDSPFVLGIRNPRIYIPFSLKGEELECVIAHEKAHIARKDHLVKPFAFLLLALHWFNPFIWIAYISLCRDIELACDEKAIRTLGEGRKGAYSQALLKCSVSRRSIAACPVAFGETGIKGRIKNVLYYKKPAFWIIVVSLLLCVAVGVCFLTNPRQEGEREVVSEVTNEGEGQNEQSVKEEQEFQTHIEEQEQPKPPVLLLQNALSSKLDYVEVGAETYQWGELRANTGTEMWESLNSENSFMAYYEEEGLFPTAAVKGQEWITLSGEEGTPYMMSYTNMESASTTGRYGGELPDKVTIREYDLLSLADVYAQPISEVTSDADIPFIMYPGRIYEVVAEWNLGQYGYRGFYGSVSYCFATSDMTGDASQTEDTVVFDAVIKEMMVDTKDSICISSESDEYPGAFVLKIPETLMDKNKLYAGGLLQITARETGEMHNNMKVLEAIEIRMHPINNDPGGAFEPAVGSKVEYEVNTLPDVKLSMNKYKSWEGEVSLRNNAEESYTYGEWFEIQYKYGEEWHRVPYISEFGYYDIAYALPAGKSEAIHINWSKIYGELPVGTYRIVKDVIDYRSPGDYDKHYLAAEFEIMPSEE